MFFWVAPHVWCTQVSKINSSVCLAGKMEDKWPEYPAATALLSDSLSVAQNYSSERCQLWKKNGLYAYAWMN